MTTGVRFRGINDTGPRNEKFTYWDLLFDVGLKGEMGEFGDYFKTWNWEAGFPLLPERGDRTCPWARSASLVCEMRCWIRTRLRPLIRSWVSLAHKHERPEQGLCNLHNTGEYELPFAMPRLTAICLIFLRGQSRLRSAASTTGRGGRAIVTHSITRSNTIGSTDREGARVNRDVWSIYEEVRVPFTSPTWNFRGSTASN